MSAEDYCDLCDLPKSTCVHGMPPAPPPPRATRATTPRAQPTPCARPRPRDHGPVRAPQVDAARGLRAGDPRDARRGRRRARAGGAVPPARGADGGAAHGRRPGDHAGGRAALAVRRPEGPPGADHRRRDDQGQAGCLGARVACSRGRAQRAGRTAGALRDRPGHRVLPRRQLLVRPGGRRAARGVRGDDPGVPRAPALGRQRPVDADAGVPLRRAAPRRPLVRGRGPLAAGLPRPAPPPPSYSPPPTPGPSSWSRWSTSRARRRRARGPELAARRRPRNI